MPSQSSRTPFQPGLEAQVDFMTELTRQTSDSVRKFSELNLHFAQQLLEDSFDATSRLMACSNPFQLPSAAALAAQPAWEHLRHYQQQLVRMLTGAQVDLARNTPLLPEASAYTKGLFASTRGDGASDAASGTRH
ncbi:phasin family protein [Massilia sp. CF038]|uniref:phasin family protein n=1 Tax=Massilia sp. CF038 TaxID=1881045 RepID=UPI00090F4264|nr:phasin family protein [Massilia sp. CF038]SHH06381.1 Phasin protein [Massilia sp. CF038]